MQDVHKLFFVFAIPFLRVAQTYTKESFCAYADNTDSMTDEMEWMWNSCNWTTDNKEWWETFLMLRWAAYT